MEIVLRGALIQADARLQDYAQNRIGKLDRLLPSAREAVVEVRQEQARSANDRIVVQVTVNANGTFLRAEERAADAHTALDEAIDALGKQMRRHKSRVYRSERSAHVARHAEEAARAPQPEDLDTEDDDLVAGHVVRVKRFAIKPMSVEEAVEQMELLGHTFFLFFDASANQYALLYRRRDGDYGMIQPSNG